MASTTVTDFDELSTALQDTSIDEIILAADITYTTSTGITVTKSDRTVVIDGTDPVDPNIRHSITDNNTTSPSYLIIVPATSVAGGFGLTFKNIMWNGRNYYGVAYVVESNSNNANTTLTIDSVTYYGPQMVHNRSGRTVIKDSNIFIGKYNSTVCPINECVETKHLEIQGTVTVDTQSTTATTCFWLCQADPTFTVAENANFTATAPNTYFFYIDGGRAATLFGAGSTTSISTYEGLYLTASAAIHTSSTFIIDTNASLKLRQTIRLGAIGSIKFYNEFTMNEGSSLDIQVTASGTSPLLNGKAASSVTFNNPKSVILYNYSSNVFTFAASGNSLDLNAELINFWQTSSSPDIAGTLDDTPLYPWSMNDNSNISVTATMSASAMTAVTSNHTGITNTTFNLFSCQALAIGALDFDVEYVNDSGAFVGTTEPEASLRAKYDSEISNDSAGTDGSINMVLVPPPALGDEVTLFANKNFLTKSLAVEAVESVYISDISDNIQFKTLVSLSSRDYLKREDSGGSYIKVIDDRPNGGEWRLYASVDGQMSSDTDTLGDVLIYKDEDTDIVLHTGNQLVYTGQWTSQGAITEISWRDIEGILLKPDSSINYKKGKYSAVINWSVEY